MNLLLKSAIAAVVSGFITGAAINHFAYARGPDGWFLSRSEYRAAVTNNVLFQSAWVSAIGGFMSTALLLSLKDESKVRDQEAALRMLSQALSEGVISPDAFAEVQGVLSDEV